MYKIFYAFLLMSSISIWTQAQDYKDLRPKEFEKKIKAPAASKEIVLIDVRTPGEVSDGYIEGALNLNVNDEAFTEQLKGLDKDKTYLVYCRSGARSKKAINIMSQSGFKKIFNLEGGMLAWQEEGLEVKKKK